MVHYEIPLSIEGGCECVDVDTDEDKETVHTLII
jgi:hypothetical protein